MSYLQGKSRTLCPEGVVKGVVKQKERILELRSQNGHHGGFVQNG